MAMILDFPIRTELDATDETATTGNDKAQLGADTAEIVIFPGVRIERWVEPVQPVQARHKSKKSAGGTQSVCRDQLEFLD